MGRTRDPVTASAVPRLPGGPLRPLIAPVLLLVVYAALSLLMSPDGYLGTDTGAKVATLEVMDRRGTASPDVGYWAERWDPEGRVHPFYQAVPVEGGWVAVTTLPMLELARPLYALGGYRATLLLPMLGSVGAALSARALAQRLGDEEDGWHAFWVVGLASPFLLYALDFWEHSLAVALVGWAVVLLVDVVRGRPWGARAAGSGLLLGAAATLRTEAIVYATVAVGVACLWLLVRCRRPVAAFWSGVLSLVAFGIPWLANRWLESSVGGLSRVTRASNVVEDATGVGGSAGPRLELGRRFDEALVTTLGLKGDSVMSVLLGMAVVALVLLAVRAERRADGRFAMVALVLAGSVYVAAWTSDPAFIPGLFLALPVALLALTAPSGRHGPMLLVIALAAMPLVWAFQYLGGAGPQWGGRYLLISSLLLGTVGIVSGLRRHPTIGRGLVALSAGVSLLAVGWLALRSRAVDDLFDRMAAHDADVLVARNAFLLREGGAAIVDQQWLSTRDEADFQRALEVARRARAETVTVVEYGGEGPPAAAVPGDFQEVEHEVVDFLSTPVGIVTYRIANG